MIPAQNIRDAFEKDDAFARAIVIELAGYFRAVVKEFKNLRLRTAVERLANWLLKYHKDQGATGRVDIPYDKKTLASILGMTPENLSRALKALRRYGVENEGTQIEIKRPDDLKALAKPTPVIDDPNI